MVDYIHAISPGRRVMVFNDPGFVLDGGAEEVLTGDYVPGLIQYRLMQDTSLKVSFYDWGQIQEVEGHFGEDVVYWADASGVVVLDVSSPRHFGWGAPFEALGLKVRNSAKLAKRLKEVVRISKYHTSQVPTIKWVPISEEKEKFYDGGSVIRRSFASKMGLPRSAKRGNFRLLGPDGLIKGDAHVVSDAQMLATHGDYDAVVPDVNLKSEIWTTGWYFASFAPYHKHNQAMFDIQSASWLREWLFPRKQIINTFTEVVDNALDSLRNGKWPAWMILPEETARTDSPLPAADTASEIFSKYYLNWQAHGMKLEHSASLLGMAAHSFGARLSAKLNYKNRFGVWKPKMWLPLPWAAYGHITTHEILELCGFEIPEEDKERLFYHEPSASFSLPGDQFEDTFEAHGTWDLDDSAKFFLRKVKGEDRVVCVIVRSPNSDGEYSIHEVNVDGFPLYHTYGEMPEIDLSVAPKRIESVMANQHVDGLPDNTTFYGGDYTVEVAEASVLVQAENPGIGQLANAMMVYYASRKTSPTRVLCTMGDAVDVTQQTPYTAAFKAINAFTDQLWEEISAHGMVDSYLARTRTPKKVADDVTVYKGYFATIFEHFRSETKRYREEARTIGFQKRAENPIVEIMERDFDPEIMNSAAKWVNAAEKQFEEITRLHGGDEDSTARVNAKRDIIYRMVAKLETMEAYEANELLLAMYRFMCIPAASGYQRYGRSDQCLFTPVEDGHTSTMDLFLRALCSIGVASAPQE